MIIKTSIEVIINLNIMNIPQYELTLIKDNIITIFSSTVLAISSFIALYSLNYIQYEKKKVIYYLLIILFIFSILILIATPNLVAMIVGWDGLGLSSFCLVIFFHNKTSLNRGLITFITNRLGDCFIILAISLLILENLISKAYDAKLLPATLLILGAITKRAQIPFSA